ncbi:hypothetical protein CPB86DRAFT_821880 [Serendipita vermifera]|nr:hypothetical protein CPB86DRAFT_821880 [Serendipita vermifera]
MPATASTNIPVPFPAYAIGEPHANGPRDSFQPAHVLTKGHHRHGHSADYTDPRVSQKTARSHVRRSEQMLSKPLPLMPDHERAPVLPPKLTEAQMYKEQALQKSMEKETPSRPSTDSRHGRSSSSLGRSVTADSKQSSSSSYGHGHRELRRKPVQTFEEQQHQPTSHHLNTSGVLAGDEPLLILEPSNGNELSGSARSRKRTVGVYRDPPSAGVGATDTWSKGTAARHMSTQPSSTGGGQTSYVVSSSSLGRHHSASAVPSRSTTLPGSASTVQAFPTTPTPKVPYTSTSPPREREQREPSGQTTPQAVPQSHQSSKRSKHVSASQGDLTTEERRRRDSHQRNPSTSTQNFSASSCSTTGSSHCDTWGSTPSQDEAPVAHVSQHHQLKKRQRGKSEAPRPSWFNDDTQPPPQPQVSVVRLGPVESRGGEERGRKKEKEGFLDRVRSRSNSLTKSISKAIQYPGYLWKDKQERRQSKQQMLKGANHSGILANSDTGHSLVYTPSTSTTTTTSTAASPTSASSHHQSPYSSSNHGHHGQSQRRLNKYSRTETEKRDMYRASPMTKAKEMVLAQWEDVDLPRRQSGVPHTQVMISQTRTDRFPPIAIPFATDGPRRR